jgi:hypothetical protein
VIALRSLEKFAKRARRAREGAVCEVCGVPIQEAHRHVVDRTERRLLCACPLCTMAFDGTQPARFRTVPQRVRGGANQGIDGDALSALGVPVGLAFFMRLGASGQWLAVFPSPAGATEAEIDESAWAAFAAKTPLVQDIADDVEALLVNRRRDGSITCFVVPVDACYELTALIRRSWQGIDGGDEVRAAIDRFFAALAERSEPYACREGAQ